MTGIDDRGSIEELETFLDNHNEIELVETLLPDVNGILRGKRIGREELQTLYREGLKICASTPFVDSRGELSFAIGIGTKDGDPDIMSYPVSGTLTTVPWLEHGKGQVFLSLADFAGRPYFSDPRQVLRSVCTRLRETGLRAVVATEFEFYLVEAGEGSIPLPKLGNVPGTSLKQAGLQYSSLEELWENDALLMDIHRNCEVQGIPATTALSEFAPGQFEINLHHVEDPLIACDQGAMLKRLIKGSSFSHGLGAAFMAKPFMDYAGCGLHVHVSLYDENGNNVFAETGAATVPAISETMRHAIGGLQACMAESMAIFAPNANSYRRLQPESFVPLSPQWGYNHRAVALRIPVCDENNMRIEHRVAGADANPHLVMAAILAGIHHGISEKCEADDMIAEGTVIEEQVVSLPTRWEAALDNFRDGKILPAYLGEEFCRVYEIARRSECDQFHAQVSNLDYEWYLRSV